MTEGVKTRIAALLKELSFNDEVQSDIKELLANLYSADSSKDIQISRSADNEFLIFITSNGTHKNLLIDEDGDIELLIIPPDRTKTYCERFYKKDGIKFSIIVETFLKNH